MCPQSKTFENIYANLDGDPPLELRGSNGYYFKGFCLKHDSGEIRFWGRIDKETEWAVLGGPVIGFHFKGNSEDGIDLTLVIGDKCRPKYFGARILFLRLGERRQVKFYW